MGVSSVSVSVLLFHRVTMAHHSVRELKAQLASAGVDISSCVEKTDLVRLWEQMSASNPAGPRAPTAQPSAAPGATRNPPQPFAGPAAQPMPGRASPAFVWEPSHTLVAAPATASALASSTAGGDLASSTAGGDRRSRQFWHAGEYKSHSASTDGPPTADELDRARVHPKFLHSNATSHKWALGAIAELLDNSDDELPNGCTCVAVDIEDDGEGGQLMSVLDDGGGMDRTRLHNMLSFGMSNGKAAQRIGQCAFARIGRMRMRALGAG